MKRLLEITARVSIHPLNGTAGVPLVIQKSALTEAMINCIRDTIAEGGEELIVGHPYAVVVTKVTVKELPWRRSS